MSEALCGCGCGEPAPIATKTSARRGWVKGQPCRFIQWHQNNPSAPEYVVSADGCWLWQRHKNTLGYGRVGSRLAHRIIFERHRGSIPEGLELDHLCRNRACVNPDHLEPVTHAENMRRSANVKLGAGGLQWAREFDAMGFRTVDIADYFGVTTGAIRAALRGHTWRDA